MADLHIHGSCVIGAIKNNITRPLRAFCCEFDYNMGRSASNQD